MPHPKLLTDLFLRGIDDVIKEAVRATQSVADVKVWPLRERLVYT